MEPILRLCPLLFQGATAKLDLEHVYVAYIPANSQINCSNHDVRLSVTQRFYISSWSQIAVKNINKHELILLFREESALQLLVETVVQEYVTTVTLPKKTVAQL